MGEERRFRSHFQVVGERRRQRIHDDRRLYRARSPAQCWRSKKNGPQAIGRSRGGLTTKIHALVDALGNPVELMLTPGQDHDLTCAEPLIENADPEALIGDKAYDADPFVETLTQRGITPVIPPKANRNIKRECDFALYCERNLVGALLQSAQALPLHRHTLRQACEKFPRRGSAGCRYNPPQLNTGPNLLQRKLITPLDVWSVSAQKAFSSKALNFLTCVPVIMIGIARSLNRVPLQSKAGSDRMSVFREIVL